MPAEFEALRALFNAPQYIYSRHGKFIYVDDKHRQKLDDGNACDVLFLLWCKRGCEVHAYIYVQYIVYIAFETADAPRDISDVCASRK